MNNYLNYRDSQRRVHYYKQEFYLQILKSCYFDRRLKFKSRFLLKVKLNNKVRKISDIQIRNRCFLTGRSRFVLRYFSLSRMSLREQLLSGFCSGFLKK
jgi:small subunit ribosomal protein S14